MERERTRATITALIMELVLKHSPVSHHNARFSWRSGRWWMKQHWNWTMKQQTLISVEESMEVSATPSSQDMVTWLSLLLHGTPVWALALQQCLIISKELISTQCPWMTNYVLAAAIHSYNIMWFYIYSWTGKHSQWSGGISDPGSEWNWYFIWNHRNISWSRCCKRPFSSGGYCSSSEL